MCLFSLWLRLFLHILSGRWKRQRGAGSGERVGARTDQRASGRAVEGFNPPSGLNRRGCCCRLLPPPPRSRLCISVVTDAAVISPASALVCVLQDEPCLRVSILCMCVCVFNPLVCTWLCVRCVCRTTVHLHPPQRAHPPFTSLLKRVFVNFTTSTCAQHHTHTHTHTHGWSDAAAAVGHSCFGKVDSPQNSCCLNIMEPVGAFFWGGGGGLRY